MYKWLSITLTTLFLSSSLNAQDPQSTGSQITAQETEVFLSGLIPSGWSIYEGVSHFTPDNLYEQINGRATFYLAYDAQTMTFAGYENSSDAGQYIDISIFDMGTPENAFGVFSAQMSDEIEKLDVGRDAYMENGHRYLWIGSYYVQIVVSSASSEISQIASEMAFSTAAYLPPQNEPLWGLEMLPLESRIPNSERYYRTAAMGLDFLRDTYIAKYEFDGVEISVFLASCDSDDEAEQTVARYLEHAKSYASSFSIEEENGLQMIVSDMGGSFDLFLARDNLVMGAYGVENRDLAIRAVQAFSQQVPEE